MLKSFTAKCLGMWICVVLTADCYNCVWALPLSVPVDPFSPQSRCQLNSRPQLSLYVYFFIVQICSHAGNTSQISYSLSKVQGRFLYTYKPKTIFQHRQPIGIAPARIKTHQTVLTSRYTGSHLVFSTIKLFSEKITKIWFFALTQSRYLWKILQLRYSQKQVNPVTL